MRSFGLVLIVIGFLETIKVNRMEAIAHTLDVPYVGLDFGPMLLIIGSLVIFIGIFLNLGKSKEKK